MDDLVTWYRAQLHADEAAAQAAYNEASDYEVVGSELAELHFVNWKPDRVLRDVAAKRAIVDMHEHETFPPDYYSGKTVGCTLCHRAHDENYPGGWCETIRHLAAALSERDGYRPEWAPS